MISQDVIAMMFINIKVFRLPILSVNHPDRRLPTGHAIAVIDANHEISEAVKTISASSCDKSCVVIAG